MKLTETWWGKYYIAFVDTFATKDNCVYCGIGRFGLFVLLLGIWLGSSLFPLWLILAIVWAGICYYTNGHDDVRNTTTNKTDKE